MGFEIEFERRDVVIAGVLVAAVLLIGLWVIMDDGVRERNMEDNYAVYDDGSVEVNGSGVMQESGYVQDDNTFQVIYGQYMTAFDLIGTYNQSTFYYGSYEEDGRTYMSLDPHLDPDDGVLDGYMIGRLTGPSDAPTMVVEIYMDQEFRAAVDDPKLVVWNQGPDVIRTYELDMEEVARGVFHMTYNETSTTRFLPSEEPSAANIFVGEVDKRDGDVWGGDIWMGLE